MLDTYINNIKTAIVNPLIVLLMAAAAVYFIWGVFIFVKNGSDGSGDSDGKRHMLYGIIGLFIMISVLGIVELIKKTVNP